MKNWQTSLKIFIPLLFISASSLAAKLPSSITVSGITSPSEANGVYTISPTTFQANTDGKGTYNYSYSYWTRTVGATTYYIYFHQFSGNSYYWDIDNDMDDQASILFYSKQYYVSNGTGDPLYIPLASNDGGSTFVTFEDVSPNLTSGWTAYAGSGTVSIAISPTTALSNTPMAKGVISSTAANTITIANAEGKSAKVIDMMGRVVAQISKLNMETQVEVPQSGIYIVMLGNQTQKIMVK
jgi:hypothetical protein